MTVLPFPVETCNRSKKRAAVRRRDGWRKSIPVYRRYATPSRAEARR